MTATLQGVVLRAATETTAHPVAEVFRLVRGEQFATAGLSAPALAGLLDMQFRAQQAQYRATHPEGRDHVIEVDGDAVGRCYVDRSGTVLRVLDLTVVPDHRRRGIGTAVLAELMAEASTRATCVHLSVWSDNTAARRLYASLGFRDREECPDSSLQLCRPPSEVDGRCPLDFSSAASPRKADAP